MISLVLLASPAVGAAPVPFPDMDGRWWRYREAVASLVRKEVLSGYPDGTFKPTATINRAELLKIVFKGKSDVTPAARRCFSDVNPDAWYAPYVCAAKSRGIVNGYPNGTFKPGEPVNFAEAVKIVLNAYGHTVTETTGADWYKPYTEELQTLTILPEHAYLPWAPLTRERAADLIWRTIRHDEDGIAPGLSAGCFTAASGDTAPTVTVGGTERTFLLTERAASVRNPAPLIVAFHGRTNGAEQVRAYMGLDREAQDSFIAYPSALTNGNGTYSWMNPGDRAPAIRDIAFFDALTEKIAEAHCIDLDRISVVGHSLGAWMANTVACIRGDVVMASATVGGDSVQTPCAGPAAAMIVHNPKDTLAPFSGAEAVRALRTAANSCTMDTVNTGPSSLNCVRQSNCTGGNDILWCPHTVDTERGTYYPHLWPQETARAIVEFFASIP